MTLSLLEIFAPDAALLALVSVGIAVVWTPLRTVLLLRQMRALDTAAGAVGQSAALRAMDTRARR